MSTLTATIRTAKPDDLDVVLELLRERVHAPLPVRGLSADQRRQAALEVYRQYWHTLEQEDRLRVFLAERNGDCVGMMIAAGATVESITGDQQTLLHDHYVRALEDRLGILRALEETAIQAASHPEDRYLVVELPPGDEDEPLFSALGYQVELNRIARRCQAHPVREDPRYLIREARPADHMFVCYLNSLVNENTIPAGRDHDPAEIGARYLENYYSLQVSGDPTTMAFICERKDPDALEEVGFRQAGYLLVKTGFQEPVTGQRLAYIYDLAVHPDHWGRRATQLLMRDVERRLAELGFDIFCGDISERNPRALKTAIKSLGFTLEYRRFGRKL